MLTGVIEEKNTQVFTAANEKEDTHVPNDPNKQDEYSAAQCR